MLDIINLNAYPNGLILLKTKGINHYKKCDYCGDTLSKFSTIRIHNSDCTCEIRGKHCPTCDLVYVPDGVPDEIIDKLKSSFGPLVQIQDNQNNPPRKDNINGRKSVQKHAIGSAKAMGKTGRPTPRTYKV